MTGPAQPRRHGSYGIDSPYAPAFIALLTLVEFVFAIITGKILPLLAGLFILAILGFTSTAPFEASSWSGPNCSTG